LYPPAPNGYNQIPVTPATDTQRAPFWIRALAATIDLIIAGVAMVLAATAVAIPLALVDAPDLLLDFAPTAAAYVAVLLYTSLEVWLAATPGKLIFGLFVGTPAGERAGRWTLALRWSSKYFGTFLAVAWSFTQDPLSNFLSGWMNLVVTVGCLQALDEHRRAWHDEWAGTAVLRRARLPVLSAPPLPRGITA
jgi:uncharacterized RDD family membrane protein YckC